MRSRIPVRSRGAVARAWACVAPALSLFLLLAPAGARGAQGAAASPVCAFSDRYPVEVAVLGSAQAREVVAQDIDVDGVFLPDGPMLPGTVRAYVNDAERATLEASGFTVTPIPNEAKEGWLEARRGWETRGAMDAPVTVPPDRAWPSYPELEADLAAVAAAHPDLCHLQSLGLSYQGRNIWIMKISDNVEEEEAEPEFKFTSSIHGDEVVGMELCRRMIHYLVDNYGTDPRVTNLVDSAELWFCPMHNPDGYVNGTRYNAQGYDLNREFPDPVTDYNDNPAGRPIEDQHFMYFGYDHNFILSANYHGGALVMNIPWDCRTSPNHTPDHNMIWNAAEGYSYRNPPLWNGQGGIGTHGVIMGGDWYVIHGGMQDWCYEWRNEADITMEIGQTKWPSWSQMDTYWDNNRESMLWYMERTIMNGVVKGIVTNAATGEPLAADVNVVEIGKKIVSDTQVGDYHRLLLPGTYSMRFSKADFLTQSVPGVVVTSGDPTVVDVALLPVGTAVPEEGGVRLALTAPAPSPTTGAVQFELSLPAAGPVAAGIFDVAGREVRTLQVGSAGVVPAGRTAISWDGRTAAGEAASSGVYFARVQAGGKTLSRSFVVMR